MSFMHGNKLVDQQSARNKTAAIIAKSLQDDDYREALLANPRNAIQQAFGKELPLGLEVRVVEESAHVVYVVLPPKPVVEVSDTDLQAVAGGFAIASVPIQGPRTTGWYPLDEWLVTCKMK
jgi:predicted CoA-binding protein